MSSTEASPATGTLGHLRECRITKLFERRDVAFEMAAGGPTLLFGRNGSGKSTILHLIDDAAHARWSRLMRRPFSTVEFEFASGSLLVVSKTTEGLLLELDGHPWQVSRADAEDGQVQEVARRRRLIYQRRSAAHGQSSLFDSDNGEPPWTYLLPSLFPVFLIEDQRLIRKLARRPSRPADNTLMRSETGPEREYAVQQFQSELSAAIQRALTIYAAHSQDVDRDFPMKIADAVEAQGHGGMSQDAEIQELRSLLERVAEERAALQNVGLLGRDEGPLHFDPSRLEAGRVLPIARAFAEDTLGKFEVLRNLRRRLELFTSFLNQHYEEKTVHTSREMGFVIMLANGDRLRPWELSSGEQQVLALAFQVLFGSDPGTLVLIDEPELSLHVLWQSTLIDDLVSMGDAQDVRFVLATHSPTLIGDRAELMRPLDTDLNDGWRPPKSRDAADELYELDELVFDDLDAGEPVEDELP